MRKKGWKRRTAARSIRLMIFLIAMVLLCGCVGNRYLAPVTTFRDKTQQTIGVLGDFYSSRNSYEIDIYLQTIAADKTLKVEMADSQGHPTPLGKPVFSPAGIKARLDSLNLVGVYAGKLYDLTNPDQKTSFSTAATTLGTSLSSLDVTFQKLQGASDPTANKYIGPVSSLIGTIGQMFLDRKRDALITQAIHDGAPQVDIILSQIRDDMDKIFSLEVTTGENEKLATLIRVYNTDRGGLDFEQRESRLAEIKAAANAAIASVGSAPSSVVTSMMEAHKALVNFANSPKDARPRSFAAFNTALDQWATQIQSVAAQMKLLIH
jgi:hypothetical protein